MAKNDLESPLYSPLNPSVYLANQEKERAIIRWIRKCEMEPLATKTLLDVGCGDGNDLLKFIQLGFRPENLVGVDLLEDRIALCRSRLPEATRTVCGDAAGLPLGSGQFDIVYLSRVFTSILDDAFRAHLAERAWRWTRFGGGVLIYDFVYNNPGNRDVKRLPLEAIRNLFPRSDIRAWRLTLAPPISRRVVLVHEALYNLLSSLHVLRTHMLCWVPKSR
ncbi:MAG: class I SAM-dependent methyltransferase [Planctomycetota bacterium]